MKKLIPFLAVGLMMMSCAYSMGPIQTQVRQLEQASEIDKSTIYTNITYRPVRQILERSCDEGSLFKAKAIVEQARLLVDQRYGVDGAYLLTDTQQLYTLIERLQKNLMSFDDSKYCTVKYVLNALQLQLREIHLQYMEQTGLIDEFQGVNEFDPVIQGFDAKLGIIENHIYQSRLAISKLGANINPKVLNPEFLNTLSAQQELLLLKAKELMENMIATSMFDLKSRGFLDQNDITTLTPLLQFEYVAACGVFNGKYEIKQTFRNDALIAQAPNALTLKVNLCPSYFVIRDLPEIYQKIITHELAHHIYYMKDENTNEFTSLCWSGEKSRTGACETNDFVTSYAQTNALEDYAEHFMHRYLDIERSQSVISQSKDRHFDRLENQLQ